jgi:hypothetical protein
MISFKSQRRLPPDGLIVNNRFKLLLSVADNLFTAAPPPPLPVCFDFLLLFFPISLYTYTLSQKRPHRLQSHGVEDKKKTNN